jgi:hypothetical protein
VGTTAIAAPRVRASHDPLTRWHLLSLDAPTVAALWVAFAARGHVSWVAPIALGVAVWILYAADRLADSAYPAEQLQERHRFHASHRRAFLVALVLAACVLCGLLIALPHGLRAAWMLLTLPLLGYVATVHVLRLRVPKEAMVGVFFAAATFLPSLLERDTAANALSAVLFGVLCWMNCVFIARKECAVERGTSTAWMARHFRSSAAAFAVVGSAIFAWVPQARAVALAVVLGFVFLLALDADERLSALHLRALADAVLLTPLLVWPLLPHLR